MIAVRVWKKLESPIAELPELDPLVGKMIEMIAMEDPGEDAPSAVEDMAEGPSHDEPIAPVEVAAPIAPPVVAAPAPPAPPPPPRRRVRIRGVIERVEDGGDTFRLAVDAEHVVPCAWAAEGVSPAIGAAGRPMVVAGTGTFDAAGNLLRVDVKAAVPALEADHRFARVPTFEDPEPTDVEEPQVLIDPPVLVDATVAEAPVPPEPPRPALSAASSFRELFRAADAEASV